MSGDRLRELFDQHAELPGDGQPVQCLDLEAFEAAARALLAEAQPQPGQPTDEDLMLLVAEYRHLSAVQFARAVLARWGRPAPEPVSVAGDPTRPAQLALDIRIACDSTWVHQPVVAALLELASQMERQPISPDTLRAVATELSRYP